MEDYSDSFLSGEENRCGCTVNTVKNSVIDNSEYWKAIVEMNRFSINVITFDKDLIKKILKKKIYPLN